MTNDRMGAPFSIRRRPGTFFPPSRGPASPPLALLAAGFLAVVAASIPAQQQFDELGGGPAASDLTLAVALGDVDGDGDLDIAVGNGDPSSFSGQQNRLYLNDGRGYYTDVTAARMPVDSDITNAVALGDVDSDGDLDMVLANGDYCTEQQNRLYLNDGSGTYTDATAARMPIGFGIYNTQAVGLGDVDGDGDLDIVFGNGFACLQVPGLPPRSEANRLLINDGTGTYTDATVARMRGAGGITDSVALGDVDGDGDLDIVFGNSPELLFSGGAVTIVGGRNTLYINDGTGIFGDVTAGRTPPVTSDPATVALGDVDGDGDLDIVLGDSSYVVQQQNRIYLNDGTGTFIDATAARMPVASFNVFALALGDVDGDGDLDIVFGNGELSGQRQNRIYLNDGSGTYTDATTARMPADNDVTDAVALGDVDSDGDLDIVFGNGDFSSGQTQQNRLYRNLLRQLDSPLTVILGGMYQLDAYARYGPPGSQDVAFLFLSGGTARIPLPPFGTFGLDPTQLLALPPLAIPQPAGVNSLSLTVPNNRNLVGVSLFAQALLWHYPNAAFLTNVTADVINP